MSTARSPIGRPIIGRPRRSLSREPDGRQGATRTNGSRIPDNSQYSIDTDEAEFIPEVPPIPDRFRPRKLSHDSDPAHESMQDPDGEKIDLKLIPAPHTRYLPNCTIGKPKEVQVISNAMMQAYVAMRGNCLGGHDENDPLFAWIQQREELARASKPKIHHKRDVSRMLELIDKALECRNPAGDSPRDCIFEVYRPDFEHIKPPQDMDLSAHLFTACVADFEWESDSDDEEGDVPSGRISPCTFLEWSQECVRWNADADENKVSVLSQETDSYLRMRPPTPKGPVPPRQHKKSIRGRVEIQHDVEDGYELSPSYELWTNPSIIYTPPGIDFKGFGNPMFQAQYKRMVPLVERELISNCYGGPAELPGVSDGEPSCFYPTEVEAAAAVMPKLECIKGPGIEATLHHQWTTIKQAEAAEKALYKQAEVQRLHIEQLKSDQRHLNKYMPALHLKRELRDQRMREARKRGEKIRTYVASHAVEAQDRLDKAWDQLNWTRAKVSENMLRIASLEHEIRELCSKAGVRSPEHAYAMLMGDEEDFADDSDAVAGLAGFDDGYGYKHGYEYGDDSVQGPWSASSVARAEEEYDRYLAEREGKGKDMRRDRQSYYDDHDSGISGIYGGDQAQGRFHFQHQNPYGVGYGA
ncbi:hypothetical protein HD806DRAFT_539584 [Xylariaceae sp. AK1471]|nr:hypothetical protein HD806DRAFT_539584 [Xylariaceae sp. AK1471]